MSTPGTQHGDPVEEQEAAGAQAPEASMPMPMEPAHSDDTPDEEDQRGGLPAGQLALGAVSVAGIGGVLMYEFAGVTWLVLTLGVGGYGAVAYARRGKDGGSRSGSAARWATTTTRTRPAGAGGVLGGGGSGGRSAGARAGRGGIPGGPRRGGGQSGAGRSGGSRSGMHMPGMGAGRRSGGRSGGVLTGSPTGRGGRGGARAAQPAGVRGVAARIPGVRSIPGVLPRPGSHGGTGRRSGGGAGPHARGGRAAGTTGRNGRGAAAQGAKGASGSNDGTTAAAGKSRVWGATAGRRRWAQWDAEMNGGMSVLAEWIDRRWRRLRGIEDESAADQRADGTDSQNRTETEADQGQTGPDRRRRRQRRDDDRTYRRNRIMSGFPLAAVAAEMNAAAAAHSPADMFAVARELDQLREIPIGVGMALRTYTQRLQGDYPINPAVVERIFELYKGIAELVPLSEEIAVLFRQVHAKDLEREEAPRTNEHAWNV